MSDLSNLTGVGVAGLSVWLFFKFAANHIEHNTRVLSELRDAVVKLVEYMENHK